MLSQLPADIQRNVALFLPAPDLLSFLTTSRVLRENLDDSHGFWKDLLSRDGAQQCYSDLETAAALKRAFVTNAYISRLATVQWCPADEQEPRPSAREGHLMCILGPASDRMVVVHGGFCDDERVHVLKLNGQEHFQSLASPGRQPSFVYGATLTALDERRALRFGGFQGGGYSAETNDVALLTLDIADDGTLTPSWERITTNGTPPPGVAYHTATLIHSRYLLIIGGMQARGSVMNTSILDTETWTWLDTEVTASYAMTDKPSRRHGHSVVLDGERNRLVLFGGGSGSDLLRSGVDNTEVWELQLGETWKTDFENSFPWAWSRIHGRDQDDEEDNDDDETSAVRDNNQQQLSPAEGLCLGRCHVCAKLCRDSVLLLFGGGRPTGNGVLGYDLSSDSFKRPTIQGPLPLGRFTAAATLIGSDGWLLVHGGYSTQEGEAIDNVDILDLAPALERTFPAFATVSEAEAISHHQIRDEEVQTVPNRAVINDPNVGVVLSQLMAAPAEQRQEVAQQLLQQLQAAGLGEGQAALTASVVASGAATIHVASREEIEAVNDSDDEEEEVDEEDEMEEDEVDEDDDDAM